MVPFQGVRLTYLQLAGQVDQLARGLMALGLDKGDRVGMWSPNNAEWVYIQFAAAKIGVGVGQHQPRVPDRGVALRAGPERLSGAGVGDRVQVQRLRGDDHRGATHRCRNSNTSCCSTRPIGPRCWLAATASARRDGSAQRDAEQRRPDQHPVHQRHDGIPEGRDAQPSQPVEQWLLPRSRFPLQRCRSGVHSRALLPLLRHGDRQPRQPHTRAPRRCCRRRRSTRSTTLQTLEAERCTSVLGVPTMFIAMLSHPDFHSFDLSSLRTGMMAGSPCPVEVMKQCVDEMHMSEVTIGYGMTETSPVSTQTSPDDPLDKKVGTVGRVLPAHRDQDHRSAHRRDRRARRAGGVLHARATR